MAEAKYEKFFFVVNNGWINNFMRHNGFLLHRKTPTSQKDSKRLIDKLILYIFHARRFSIKYKYPPSSIIAMNETSTWNYMVSNTSIDKQGPKSVRLKTTGHERCMVSVCLAAKADGTKLKPFVFFVHPKEKLNHLVTNSNSVVQLRVLVTPG